MRRAMESTRLRLMDSETFGTSDRHTCSVDNLRAVLTASNSFDVIQCHDESAAQVFAKWLRDNNKRGCISWMPKGGFYSMYFKD